jgi:hypothetical protein
MKKLLLTGLIVITAITVFGAVKTWTGTTSAVWTVGTNWSPAGAPANGDEVILNANGLNRNITGFTTIQLSRLVVSNANGGTTYSIRSTGDQALTITGGAGDDLDVQSACGLTFRDHLTITINSGCTASIAGNLTTNLTASTHNLTFSSNTTTTVTGSLTFGGAFPGGTIIVEAGALIEGFGNIAHAVGPMTVDGNITFDGNFTNTSPITGVGTIETQGTWINASTLFGYPETPAGPIISGYTWSGEISSDWTDPANWYGLATPVATGDVVIYFVSTVFPEIGDAGQECKRLYINDDGSLLTITEDGQLTAFGATTLGGGGGGSGGAVALLIESNASGTGSFIDNGTIDGAGVATMQRFFDYGSVGLWHYACLPMADVNAWTYWDQYMKYYDESTHHFKYVIAYLADSTLTSDGLGYAVWPKLSDWTADNTGIPLTGTVNIPVTRTYNSGTSDYDGWNLVGNPYTSAVDLSTLTGSWTNVDATAWFWDPLAGNYKVYPTGGGGSHSQYCPPEQGFFVHCNDASATPSVAGTGTVAMDNAARVHNTEAFMKETMANILKFNVQGSANAFNDELSVYFNDALTNGYDPGFDAEKIEGEATAPQIFTTIPGVELAVNALPFTGDEMTVPMSFKAALPGSYMLTAGELESFSSDMSVSLEDLKTGFVQDLRSNAVYSFSHDPANDPARFLIRFSTDALSGGHSGNMQKAITVYSSGSTIYVNNAGSTATAGTMNVYDILGREVYRSALENVPLGIYPVNVAPGYYVVRLRTSETAVNQKIYLR